MSEWIIEVRGDPMAVEAVLRLPAQPEWEVIRDEQRGPAFKGSLFESMEGHAEIRKAAEELVAQINRTIILTAPGTGAVTLGIIVRRNPAPSNLVEIYATDSLAVSVSEHVSIVAKVVSNGRVDFIKASAHEKAKIEAAAQQAAFVELQRQNPDVQRAMRIFTGLEIRDWNGLKGVIEVIAYDLGSKRDPYAELSNRGWADAATLNRLNETANNYVYAGDKARHQKPPKSAKYLPLPWDEAREIVRILLMHWCNWKGNRDQQN